MTDPVLPVTGDADADALLVQDPLARLIGMLLDQQVPMEWAFSGPYTIATRMGHDDLDAHEIAARDPEAFAALLSEKPAVHRYPGSMAQRIQQLCRFLVDEYGGAAAVRIVTAEVTQVLVMVRVEKRWLVREVYDLADQP